MFLRELYYLYKTTLQDNYNDNKKKELQFFFLKNIIEHAYKKNEFYREYYKKKNFHPSQLKKLENLERIPLIDKPFLLKNYNKLVNKTLMKDYNIIYTSGTSGKEFSVYLNDETSDYNNCIFIRTLMKQGYNPLKKLGFYWYRKEKNSFFNNLGISRKVIIKYDSTPEEQLNIIKKHKLEYLYYFPFKLLELANSFEDTELKSLKIKRIFCIGEIMTPKMKTYFESKFGCPVSNNYGLTEFNISAYLNSNETNFNINWDNVIIELKETKNHNIKQIIMTSLSNYFMPIIRYKTDDYIEVSDNGSIISILGAKNNFLAVGKKNIYIGEMVDKMIDLEGIKLFTFQYKKGELTIYIVVNSSFSDKTSMKIKQKFEKLGFKKINIKKKENILFSKRGKLKLLNVI